MLARNLYALIALVVFATLAAPAVAEDGAASVAGQLAGLFVQSCLEFAGNSNALRDWAKQTGLQELPGQAQDAFLYGLPGVVFDATNKTGKLVLISEDGGSCSVVAERASGAAVIDTLEQELRRAKISFNLSHDGDDPKERVLHHREYTATMGKRSWLLLVSTVKDSAAGEAMLTANAD
jgi:hypothetical protein